MQIDVYYVELTIWDQINKCYDMLSEFMINIIKYVNLLLKIT